MILLEFLAGYGLIGGAVALAFLVFGLARVLGPDEGATLPARVLLLPGAIVFWPLVLARWIGASR